MTTPRQPFKKLRRPKRSTDNLAAFRRPEKASAAVGNMQHTERDTGHDAGRDTGPHRDHDTAPDASPDASPAARTTPQGPHGIGQSEAHRARLLKALEATKARLTVTKPAAKYRIGEWFQVINGEYAGCRGSVLELNFIDNQAYLQMTIVPEPVWIAFEDLSPDDTDL